MKLAVKSAILCGTGAFLIATYTSMVKTLDPKTLSVVIQDAELLKNLFDPVGILTIAVPGALVVGAIGYFLGDIFSKPNAAKKKKPKRQHQSFNDDEALSLSGEELFLDDLDMEPLPDDVIADPETLQYTDAVDSGLSNKQE